MPASYAHYRFGKQVLPALPAEIRQNIQRFRRLYDMGLQGPDFFFYYNPLMKTGIGDLGAQFHSQTGQVFFENACKAATSEAAQAYLYGLLCHYCLDSECHPFVESKVKTGEARHVALESEFDRYLLTLDGCESPHTYDLSPHLKLTRGECMTVAAFFPPATGGNVNQAVRFMGSSLRLLSSKDRKAREKLLRMVKPSLLDSLVPEEPVESYARMDSELLARFNRAAKGYPERLERLRAFQNQGQPLGDDFLATFG